MSALVTDTPWSSRRPKTPLFFTLILFGIAGGAFEGWILYRFRSSEYWRGDALLWDGVDQFSLLGAAVGLACSIAMTSTRNLFLRMMVGAMVGVGLVSAAMLAYSQGRPTEVWGLNASGIGNPFEEFCLNWGIRLGAGATAAGVLGCHLLRRCSGKLRLTLLAMALGGVVAVRSQFLFWEMWNPPHFDSRCFRQEESYFPSWMGGLLQGSSLFLGVLLTDLLERGLARRNQARWLPIGLGSCTLLIMVVLGWAGQAMPWTVPSSVRGLQFTRDGRFVLSAHTADTVRLWRIDEDPSSGNLVATEIRKVRLHRGPIWSSTFALTDNYFAAATADGRLGVWETETIRPLFEGWDPDRRYGGLAISPDGTFLATSESNRRDYVWRIAPGTTDGGFRLEEAARFSDGIQAHRLRFSPDGKTILSASSGTLMTREWQAGLSHLWEERLRHGWSWSAEWTPDGAAIAVASEQGAVYFFDPDLNGWFHRVELGPQSIWHLAFSPDSRDLATGLGSSVQIHDLSSGELQQTLDGGPNDSSMSIIAYSNDGRIVAAGGSDGEIKIWRRAAPRLK